MTDLLRSVIEFQRRFGDEAVCAKYLAATRWPNGFACPSCGNAKEGMAHGDRALDLRVRNLRPPRFGHDIHNHAPFQVAAHRLILGRLPDGDAFQRHLGPANATPTAPDAIADWQRTSRQTSTLRALSSTPLPSCSSSSASRVLHDFRNRL